MRKAVLTSSEVSVLASMTVVMLCTLALFLSGFAIQQRTLRDLRAAIRPRDSPPARLLGQRPPTPMTRSDGGAAVRVVGSETEAADAGMRLHERGVDDTEDVEDEKQERDKAQKARAQDDERRQRQRAVVEELKALAAAKAWGVEHPDPAVKSRIPISAAERRRIIKEELRRLAPAEQPAYYRRRLW